jgi:acetyl-CoA C-acetyltransferase
VLIGVGQWIQRDVAPAEAPSPLDSLEQVSRAAFEDAGLDARAAGGIDTVGVVDVLGWHPKNAPGLLAERLGAKPRRHLVTAVGGEMPLVLVNEVARRIAAGQVRLALVSGTNNMRTLRRARKARLELPWPKGGQGEPETVGVSRGGNSWGEAEYGLGRPTDVYPIFENALRARRGLSLDAHRRRLGALMSRFSAVAAANPYAWFPVERSADEIATADPNNRMIAFPYTKYMNAVMDTDQAAAVVVASAAAARELGVPDDRQVHWWGGGQAIEEPWFASDRPDHARCPALASAAFAALDEAGLHLPDVDRLDFYSCFPSAVEMACEMLGLEPDDPRGLTVTGGLPYAGGPGNDYTLHSLATVAERLREQRGASGLVTGNGWYLTKHSATVLASAPREGTPGPAPSLPPVPDIEETEATAPAEGPARIETYTVLYERDGTPARGVIVGRTDAGRRFVANTPEDRALLEALVSKEAVGHPGQVTPHNAHNLFLP